MEGSRKKRVADRQLSKDDEQVEDESGTTDTGTWQKADDEVLSRRRKVVVSRRSKSQQEGEDTAKPTVSYPTFSFTPQEQGNGSQPAGEKEKPKVEEEKKIEEKKEEKKEEMEKKGGEEEKEKKPTENEQKEEGEAVKKQKEGEEDEREKEKNNETKKEENVKKKEEEETKEQKKPDSTPQYNFATSFNFNLSTTGSTSSSTPIFSPPSVSFAFSAPDLSTSTSGPIFGQNISKPSPSKGVISPAPVISEVKSKLLGEPMKTGEEDEFHVFQSRAKLFILDASANQWRERGVGQIRLNVDEEHGFSRLIMRVEGSLRLILNVRLWSNIQPTAAGEKGVQFIAPTLDDPGTLCNYLIRLGRADSAKELIDAIEKNKTVAKKSGEKDEQEEKSKKEESKETA